MLEFCEFQLSKPWLSPVGAGIFLLKSNKFFFCIKCPPLEILLLLG